MFHNFFLVQITFFKCITNLVIAIFWVATVIPVASVATVTTLTSVTTITTVTIVTSVTSIIEKYLILLLCKGNFLTKSTNRLTDRQLERIWAEEKYIYIYIIIILIYFYWIPIALPVAILYKSALVIARFIAYDFRLVQIYFCW